MGLVMVFCFLILDHQFQSVTIYSMGGFKEGLEGTSPAF